MDSTCSFASQGCKPDACRVKAGPPTRHCLAGGVCPHVKGGDHLPAWFGHLREVASIPGSGCLSLAGRPLQGLTLESPHVPSAEDPQGGVCPEQLCIVGRGAAVAPAWQGIAVWVCRVHAVGFQPPPVPHK